MLMLVSSVGMIAQEAEETKPLTDAKIERRVSWVDIDGLRLRDVIMTFKSLTPDYQLTKKYRVKVTVMNTEGKTIWKRTLKNAFLYVFSDGQIQVGRKNFTQVLVQRDKETAQYIGIIREKEGVY